MNTISYAITACNEHEELEILLTYLDRKLRPEDEIVVQLDTTATEEVKEVVKKFNIGTRYEFHRIFFPLNNDFASFKNNLAQHCTRDYIFQIDADEMPCEILIDALPAILESNKEVEMFLVARVNIVKGLTSEHIKAWGWNVDSRGWVNYPDYQYRLWKNRVGIKWVNKVHERLEGYKTFATLPSEPTYSLMHHKTIERQEKQNNFYNTI